MYKLRLIQWNVEESKTRITQLTALGYEVEGTPITNSSLRAMWENPPDAVVIDLTHLPSQGRDLGIMIRKRKSTRRTPIIFVGGADEKVDRVKSLLPDAYYTSWEHVSDTVSDAIQHPQTNPVVPESGMAAYAGTPLLQKLGIHTDMTVGLFGTPPDFQQILGTLPPRVSLATEPDVRCDLLIWFVHTHRDLHKDFEKVVSYVGDGGLWIIWPKNSIKITGLSQNVVRKTGMAKGLVDYKIASIDNKWSGLRFTYKSKT
jgi:CheY-like chemotaxis protein